MILTVIRDRKTLPPEVAAIVKTEQGQIRIVSSTKALLKLIERILPHPTKIKERVGNKVFKRDPKSADEDVFFTLKQNLYYPYQIDRSNKYKDSKFQAKYHKVYHDNVLRGGMTNGLNAEAG